MGTLLIIFPLTSFVSFILQSMAHHKIYRQVITEVTPRSQTLDLTDFLHHLPPCFGKICRLNSPYYKIPLWLQPYDGLRFWLKLLPPWSSDQSSEAAITFGLLPMKYCPLEVDMTASCGWMFAHNFTHFISSGIFKIPSDIYVNFVCVCVFCR